MIIQILGKVLGPEISHCNTNLHPQAKVTGGEYFSYSFNVYE
jgi:hypothetical protein